VDKKIKRKERMYETERLMREKRSEEYEVIEEVFDKSTLMTIYNFLNKRIIDEIYGVVKSGKEARIYWGKDTAGKELAIKIFLTVSSEFRKGMMQYIQGDPRFSNVRRDSRSLVYTWAKKEFKNLQRAAQIGIPVPIPIAVKKNVLVMEFIGENGESAPLLKDVILKDVELTYNQLLGYVSELFQKAKLVHGDLSEYNIMIHEDNPILIDFSQSVLIEHPMAMDFLNRDIKNLRRYFQKQGLDLPTLEELVESVIHGTT
jgi:RIO kinase 1